MFCTWVITCGGDGGKAGKAIGGGGAGAIWWD